MRLAPQGRGLSESMLIQPGRERSPSGFAQVPGVDVFTRGDSLGDLIVGGRALLHIAWNTADKFSGFHSA